MWSRKAFLNCRPCRAVFLPILYLPGVARAQAVEAAAGIVHSEGIVTGDVYDVATRLPVRFAEVRLVPLPVERKTDARSQDAAKADAAPIRPEPQVMSVSGHSGLDGKVMMRGVPAGDYLVLVLKAGYVSPVGDPGSSFRIGTERLAQLVATLPSVHVVAGGEATMHVPLERGATISGTVRYADGSPAIHVAVTAEPVVNPLEPKHAKEARTEPISALEGTLMQPETLPSGRSREMVTDDEGRFRIAGLAPGRYNVDTVTTMDRRPAQGGMSDGSIWPGSRFTDPEIIGIYAPGVFRQDAAKVFEISSGEQLADADVTIDTAGLHTLRGRAFAARDHHAPSGLTVQLCYGSPKTLMRFVSSDADGSFQVNALPAGSYALTIEATDQGTAGTPSFFKSAEVAVEIREADVVVPDVVLTLLPPGQFWSIGLCGVPPATTEP